MTLEVTDAIFKAAATGCIDLHAVPDAQVKELCRVIRTVDRLANESDVEDVVAPAIRQLKAVRFALASTPLPGSWENLKITATANAIENHAERWTRILPDSRLPEAASRAVPILQSLAQQSENPLGAKFRELVTAQQSPERPAAIVLKDARYETMVTQWLKTFCRAPLPAILPPSALRGSEYYFQLYIFGCPRWFRNDNAGFLFDAPRAHRVDILAFAWGGLELAGNVVFPTPHNKPTGFGNQRGTIIVHGREEPPDPDLVDDLAQTATIDARTYLARQRSGGGTVPHEEEYPARLVQLAGNSAVFLEWDEKAATYFIDMTTSSDEIAEGETGLVRRERNHALEEGDFIILRTGGGGDLVPVVADTILKETATGLRQRQREWKHALHDLHTKTGEIDLCNRLATAGAVRANSNNIRNWIRERTIRPDADADFIAILTLCGLAPRKTEYFETAAMIENAHHKAGFLIRRQLIEKIRKADLKQLRQTGTLVFQLEDLSQEASMTAYRIERIQQETVMAQSHELGHPFQPEDDLWQ